MGGVVCEWEGGVVGGYQKMKNSVFILLGCKLPKQNQASYSAWEA